QYDAQRDGLDQISAKFILLDAGLAQYGPEASRARDLLRQTVASAVSRIWPQDSPQTSSLTAPDTTAGGRAIYEEVQKLSPKNDMQRRIQSQALQLLQELGQTRWLLAAQRESRAVRQLWAPFPTECDGRRCSCRVCIFGLGSALSCPGIGTPVRGTAAAVQCPDASRSCKHRAVVIRRMSLETVLPEPSMTFFERTHGLE